MSVHTPTCIILKLQTRLNTPTHSHKVKIRKKMIEHDISDKIIRLLSSQNCKCSVLQCVAVWCSVLQCVVIIRLVSSQHCKLAYLPRLIYINIRYTQIFLICIYIYITFTLNVYVCYVNMCIHSYDARNHFNTAHSTLTYTPRLLPLQYHKLYHFKITKYMKKHKVCRQKNTSPRYSFILIRITYTLHYSNHLDALLF